MTSLANSRYNLRLGALAQSRCKLLIHNDFSVFLRAKTIRTVVFAQSTTHARLMIEYVFGMNSVVSHPVLAEATSPTTPEQQRLATLRATKDRAAVALDAERKRQQAARAQKAMAAAGQPTRPATLGMQ